MITPGEISKKAQKLWNSGDFIRDWSEKKEIFPVIIPAGKISSRSMTENFSALRESISTLREQSKENIGYGYTVTYKKVKNRQFGRQSVPEKIIIETERDFLTLCSKEKEFDTFKEVYIATEKRYPELCSFMIDNHLLAMEYLTVWNELIDICLYFRKSPKPHLYIRQIVIPGIDTKFIEAHKKVIVRLLVFLHPGEYGSVPFPLGNHGFEKQFGLLYDEPQIRFRILDDGLLINNLSDIAMPLGQFTANGVNVEKIFITENKINGLAFPKVKKAMVIFGLGYGIQVLKDIPWLRDKEIWYWGDIDTHGFAILSQLRGILPHCRSMLMDEDTLISHKMQWVEEPESKRTMAELVHLTHDEAALYEKLKNNRLGRNIRLEQELVSYNFLGEWLSGRNVIG
jgi:hypothetical protein